MFACPATDDFFRARIDQMIDLRHPLAVLASRMPWPISLSTLKPPMPGPWPARGSITTNGRFMGSAGLSSGGRIRTSQ